jgi:hypothetical protein
MNAKLGPINVFSYSTLFLRGKGLLYCKKEGFFVGKERTQALGSFKEQGQGTKEPGRGQG